MSWREEAASEAKEKKAASSYTMDVGDNSFRIMPNKKGTKFRPYVAFRLHREVGPEKVWVMCGRNTRGEGKCWLCDKMIPELEASASEQKRQMASKMQPKDNLILQVSPIDPKTKKFMAPKAYWAPYTGGRSLGVHILARLGDVSRSAIDDPVNGRNLTVERTGSGLKTRYGPLNVDEDKSAVPQNILAMIKPLEELVPVYNPKRQLAAYKGEKFEDSDAPPVAVEEETGTDEDYQLDEPTVEGEVEGEAESEEFADDNPEEFADQESELEPDPGEELPEDELGEFGEEFSDDLPPNEFEPEPEPEPVRTAPRRTAPATQPARRAATAAAAAPSRGVTQARTPARPATRTQAPPARSPAKRPAQPPARGSKPSGRR